jgi:hypothetical protein
MCQDKRSIATTTIVIVVVVIRMVVAQVQQACRRPRKPPPRQRQVCRHVVRSHPCRCFGLFTLCHMLLRTVACLQR